MVIVATPIGYVHITNNINMRKLLRIVIFFGEGDGMDVWPSDDKAIVLSSEFFDGFLICTRKMFTRLKKCINIRV